MKKFSAIFFNKKLLIIIALALTLRVIGLPFGLPGLVVADEGAYLSTALRVAQGELPNQYRFAAAFLPYLQVPFLGITFVMLRVVGIVHSLSDFTGLYFTDRTAFILSIRALSVLAGTLSIALIYYAGKILNSKKTGLLAALIFAITPYHVYYSHVGLPDVVGIAFALLTLVGILKIWRNGRSIKIYTFVAVSLAWTMLTRIDIAGSLGLGLLYAHFFPNDKSLTDTKSVISALKQWRNLVLCGVAGLFALLLSNPVIWIQPVETYQDLRILLSAQYGSTPFSFSSMIGILQYTLSQLTTIVLGWQLSLLGLLGFIFLLVRRSPASGILAVITIPYLAIIGLDHALMNSHWLPITPFVILVTVLGLEKITLPDKKHVIYYLVLYSGVGLIASSGFLSSVLADRILSFKDTRLLARDFISENIPPNSKVLIGDMYIYSVPLWRTVSSAENFEKLSGSQSPTYTYWIAQSRSVWPQPSFEIFGVEYRGLIKTEDDVRTFVKVNNIRYVVDTDYCQLEHLSPSPIGFPPIGNIKWDEYKLVAAFSPYAAGDVCLDIIGTRMSLDSGDLFERMRLGPIVRIYEIASPK